MNKATSGFTIVELLIVIVIIAVLAAISIIGYNGFRQRTDNTAITHAVSQTIRMIQAYVNQEGEYPLAVTGSACVTTTSGCADFNNTFTANTTFDTNIAKVGAVPRSVPKDGANGYGITYSYSPSRQFNGAPRPALLMYFLSGTAQKCGVSDVMSAWGTPGQEAVTASNGYTASSSANNKTVCFVSVP